MKRITIKTVIIDDEAGAVELLQEMVSAIPEVEVVATFTDPVKMLLEIPKINPDLVFLDIQMPRMNGMELLRGIRNEGLNPRVIFVTAYDQFAIEAIHSEAFDYLLKPVSPEELADSVSRLFVKITDGEAPQANAPHLTRMASGKISFNDRNGISYFAPSEIIYVEADGNYSKLRLRDRQHIVTRKIGELESLLAPHGFQRISRSYLINAVYLSRVDRRLHICILEYEGARYELPVSASSDLFIQ